MAFKSFQSTSVTTETTVYTGPASTETTVIGLSVACTAASPATVSVKLNSAYIVKDAPVPVGGALVAIGGEQKVVVEATDTLSVISDETVDVITSVLEI
jgi:hypothetical protein